MDRFLTLLQVLPRLPVAFVAALVSAGSIHRARQLRARRPARARVAAFGSGPSSPVSARWPHALTWGRSVGPRSGRLVRQALRRPEDDTLDARLGWALLSAAAALVGVGPVGAVAVGLAVWARSVLRQRGVRRRADIAVLDAVPDTIELLRLAADSGLTVRLAVDAVGAHAQGPIPDRFAAVSRRVHRGDRLASALAELEPLGPACRPVLDALLASERYGVPLAPALERLAIDARDQRRRRREEAARRVPVQMLFPLVCCTLPALVVLTVVPLLARSFPALAP